MLLRCFPAVSGRVVEPLLLLLSLEQLNVTGVQQTLRGFTERQRISVQSPNDVLAVGNSVMQVFDEVMCSCVVVALFHSPSLRVVNLRNR